MELDTHNTNNIFFKDTVPVSMAYAKYIATCERIIFSLIRKINHLSRRINDIRERRQYLEKLHNLCSTRVVGAAFAEYVASENNRALQLRSKVLQLMNEYHLEEDHRRQVSIVREQETTLVNLLKVESLLLVLIIIASHWSNEAATETLWASEAARKAAQAPEPAAGAPGRGGLADEANTEEALLSTPQSDASAIPPAASAPVASAPGRDGQADELPNLDGENWNLICPISLDILEDPVVAADGFTYSRVEIERWFKRGKISSPMTGENLPSLKLRPNCQVAEQLKMLHR